MRPSILALVLIPLGIGKLNAQSVLTPTIEVVANGGGQLWDEITELVPLPDSAIVALFPGEGLLRLFPGHGKEGRTIGRPGAGPGEFRRIASAGEFDGNIWVHDRGNARIQLFDLKGAVLRSFHIAGVHRSGRSADSSWVAVIRTIYALGRNDSLLIEVSQGNPRAGVASRVVYQSSSSGALTRKLLVLPKEDCRRGVTIEGRPGSVRLPFCAPPVFAASADGSHAAQLVVTTGDNPRYCLRLFVIGTAQSSESCAPYHPVAIPKAEMDSAMDYLAEHAPNSEFKRAIEHLDNLPTDLPAFDRLFVANDGTMWVREWSRVGDQVWRRQLPGRTTYDLVHFPADLVVRAVSTNKLWAVRTAPDGDEEIVSIVVKPHG